MSLTSLKPAEVDLLARTEFVSGYDTFVPVGSSIFNIASPQRLNELESIVATDGDIPQAADGAEYPEAQIRQIGTKSFTSVEYKRMYGISELMKDFSNYGSTMKAMRNAGYRARYKQDDLLSRVLSQGFATTTTWDGAYLFSASHQYGDVTGQTQSNLLSGALSKTTINSGYVKLRTLKDHDGLTMPLAVAYLLVPSALAMTAWELVNSPDDPETGNRSRNFVNSRSIKVVEWPLLDAISTTAFFMCSEKMFHQLTAYQKVQPTLSMFTDGRTGTMYEKIRFVQTQGAADYLGATGGTGL